jgi:hypothetical protein
MKTYASDSVATETGVKKINWVKEYNNIIT